MQSFLFDTINHASRTADKSKVQVLGPYCKALGTIVMWANNNRKDITPFGVDNPVDLLRGVAYTQE